MEARFDYAKAAPGVVSRAGTEWSSILQAAGWTKILLQLGSAARLTDQRLRLLHRHALEGSARCGRDRTAAVRAGRMARVAVLLRAERAALAWTEAVTLVAATHVPDSVYEEVRPYFNFTELSNLTLAVAAINAWNRLAISTRAEPGKYQVGQFQEQRRAS